MYHPGDWAEAAVSVRIWTQTRLVRPAKPDQGLVVSYRVSHDTGHLEILAKFKALYKHELDTWILSKCLIL